MTDMLIRPAVAAPTYAAAPGRDADEIDETLVCVDVRPVTHDVVSLTLAPTEPRSFTFEAGQYVTVRVVVDGEPLERCYSISSPPSRRDTIEVTVKRVPGGPVSNWLHDHVVAGSRLHVSGPYGLFTRAGRTGAKELLLSAGSGITPMMSMVRDLRVRGGASDIVLVHNARTPADIVFRDELEAPPDGVVVAAVCERDAPGETWTGHRGLLTLPMLRAIAPDLLERDVLLCGPPPYMAAVRDLLVAAGVDPARCREERFELGVGGTGDDADAPPPPSDVRLHSVELRRSGRTITCDADTTILDATADAGISVPASCHEGLCGTCKSDLLSGSVDMQHQGGIRPREIREGKILLCCSTPTDDLVIDA